MTRTYFIKVILLSLVLSFIQFGSTASWAADKDANPKKPIYYAFPEPFTINFLRQSNDTARYLQIKVSIMSYDQTVIDNAELNLPMLQDALLTLFTTQSLESVSSVEGRRAIQDEAASAIKTLLKQETGSDNLEGVYFTSFILQ
ncbi:MAG: flagellar basal body-associated FliL family protein [Gammaproteobacteria bacterium]|nr:flagellar basal body-associated FliL family protein [Gammaproteobacteria bacterium]